MAKTIYRQEELERQLAESRREFWAADATINNLELKLADMAAQLANAEAKCAALAAEKDTFAVECAASKTAIAYLKSGRQGFSLNTPATDAFLAEVRAQGVEMFAIWNDKHIEKGDEYEDVLAEVGKAARGFAEKLRQNTNSDMLHGSEPETDNTNQQFESLGRGDK